MGQGAGVRGWSQPPVSAAVAGGGGGVTGSSDASLIIAGADAIINVAHINTWSVQQRFINPASASTSVGGAINVDATGGTGAGIIAYTNRGADAAGRLMNLRVDNPANPQAALNINYLGAGHAVTIQHTPAGGTGSEALDVTSTNRSDTTVGISGVETGRGTLKVTHDHPAGALAADDANAAVLRLNWADTAATGTAVQGIVGQSEPGGPTTTGDLIRIYAGPIAGANPKIQLTAAGKLRGDAMTVVGGPASGQALTLQPNDSAAGAAAQLVVNLQDDPGHTVQVNLNNSTRGANQVAFNVGTGQSLIYTITGALLGYRAFVVSPAIQIGATGGAAVNPNGVLGLVFNHAPVITLNNAAASNINAIRVFHNNPTFTLAAGSNLNYAGVGAADDATLYDNPFWTAQTGTEFARIAEHSTVWFRGSIGLGWTIDVLRGLFYRIPQGGGTITDWAVIDIQALDTFGGVLTNPVKSLRSAGVAVQMQHAGPAVFGAAAVPTVGSVALEVQSTTASFLASRMTVAQRNALTAVDGMLLYDSDAPAGFDVRVSGAWRRIPATLTDVKEVEIDVGSTPVRDALINTIDTAVAVNSKIIFAISGNAPTGKDTDDVWMDAIIIQPEPKAGSIDWRIRDANDEHIAGAFKIEYLVS